MMTKEQLDVFRIRTHGAGLTLGEERMVVDEALGLMARVRELEAALRPFAEAFMASNVPYHHQDDWLVSIVVTNAMARNACILLKNVEAKEDET
jgi:hypothetical protein